MGIARKRPVLPVGVLLCLPAITFLIAFFIGPLLLNAGQSLQRPDGGVGLTQYVRALGDSYYLGVLGATVLLSAAVTLATLMLGYPLALAIARSSGRTKSLLIFLVVTPLLINVVVRTFGWMVILGRSGLVNGLLKMLGLETVDIASGWFAIWLALVHVLLPFMVISVWASLQRLDRKVPLAALSLGAGQGTVFLRVILPQVIPGILSGSLIVFALASSAFATPAIIGGRQLKVVATATYDEFLSTLNWPLGAAIAVCLLVLNATLMLSYNAILERRYARSLG